MTAPFTSCARETTQGMCSQENVNITSRDSFKSSPGAKWKRIYSTLVVYFYHMVITYFSACSF